MLKHATEMLHLASYNDAGAIMVFTSPEDTEESGQMAKNRMTKARKVSVKSKERKRAAKKEPG